MAIGTTADISPVLTSAFGPDLVRLWNRQANLVSTCMQVKLGDFKQVFWAASPAATTAKAVAEGYQVVSSDFTNDSVVSMTLSRAQYIVPFSMSDTEIAVARRSALSPTALFDMVGERVFEATTALTSKINADSFTGNGTDAVTGAQNIVGLENALLTSGSYAGQNVGSVTSLQSNVSGANASPVALTLAQLQSDITSIFIKSGKKPDAIIAHPYVTASLQALYETNHRIVTIASPLSLYSAGPSMAFNGAATGLEFDGIPVLNDKDGYVSGTQGSGFGSIYYINKKSLELDVLPHHNPLDGSEWSNESMISAASDEADMVSSNVISIVSLARNGLAATFAVNVECQLKVKNPRVFGIRRGVNI